MSPDDFVRGMCIAYRVDPDDMRAQCRWRELAKIRHVIAWGLRKHCGLSYPGIGRVMRRDHTTAMHSVRAVDDGIAAGLHWALEGVAIAAQVAAPLPVENALESLLELQLRQA